MMRLYLNFHGSGDYVERRGLENEKLCEREETESFHPIIYIYIYDGLDFLAFYF